MSLKNVSVGVIESLDSDLKFNFMWKITDFSKKCQKAGDFIDSPLYEYKDLKQRNQKINLFIRPFGDKIKTEGYISVYLRLHVDYKVQASANIRFLNSQGSEFQSQNFTHILIYKSPGYGWPTFIKRNSILKNEVINFDDDILIVECRATISPANDELKIPNLMDGLTDDLEQLFENGTFSDVTIIINNKKLKAHKSILVSRSSVFSAMFSSNMKESRENIIKITDIDYDAMKEVLRFMYCGRVKHLDKLTKHILKAADKYDIINLKIMCEETLKKSINLNNCCEMVKIIQLHDCIYLKKSVINFIIDHPEVLESENFQKVAKCNSQLLIDIIRKQNQQKKN